MRHTSFFKLITILGLVSELFVNGYSIITINKKVPNRMLEIMHNAATQCHGVEKWIDDVHVPELEQYKSDATTTTIDSTEGKKASSATNLEEKPKTPSSITNQATAHMYTKKTASDRTNNGSVIPSIQNFKDDEDDKDDGDDGVKSSALSMRRRIPTVLSIHTGLPAPGKQPQIKEETPDIENSEKSKNAIDKEEIYNTCDLLRFLILSHIKEKNVDNTSVFFFNFLARDVDEKDAEKKDADKKNAQEVKNEKKEPVVAKKIVITQKYEEIFNKKLELECYCNTLLRLISCMCVKLMDEPVGENYIAALDTKKPFKDMDPKIYESLLLLAITNDHIDIKMVVVNINDYGLDKQNINKFVDHVQKLRSESMREKQIFFLTGIVPHELEQRFNVNDAPKEHEPDITDPISENAQKISPRLTCKKTKTSFLLDDLKLKKKNEMFMYEIKDKKCGKVNFDYQIAIQGNKYTVNEKNTKIFDSLYEYDKDSEQPNQEYSKNKGSEYLFI